MQLSTTWFTEPVFDAEYKKYQLLAYLKEKQDALQSRRIFPHLHELEQHVQSLRQFQQLKNRYDLQFKKELKGIDTESMTLHYQPTIDLHIGLQELLDIVSYSHEKMSACYHRFSEESEELRLKIEVRCEGLIPGYRREGFLLVHQSKDSYLFSYSHHTVLNAEGNSRLEYRFIDNFSRSISVTDANLRIQIYKKYQHEFDHPAVFTVISDPDLPVYETLLPLSEKELLKWVA